MSDTTITIPTSNKTGETDKTGETTETANALTSLLQTMSPQEQRHALDLLQRAKNDHDTIDPISLVHASLLSRREDAATMDYDEISTAKAPPVMRAYPDHERVMLPRTPLAIEHPLPEVLNARASRRDYTHRPLTLDELGSLLNLSYGVKKHILAYNTRDFPVRYAPSQGGLQSIELYVVVNRVESVDRGLYSYYAEDPSLVALNKGNHSQQITSACIFQEYVQHAAAVLVLAVAMDRIEWKYGTRGYRFAHVDAGVLAQQIYLVATGLHLRTTAIAAFYDKDVNRMLNVDGRNEFATLVMPIGAKPNWDDVGA